MCAQLRNVVGRIAAAFAIVLSFCFAPPGIGTPALRAGSGAPDAKNADTLLRESGQSSAFGGIVLYVDDDAPPGGDGSSWQTAFQFLQDALAVAADPQNLVVEIRVAQGTYKPDQGANQTPGDRNAVFTIPGGIALRGGYAGLSGEDPEKRDWETFPTIFSGDLLSNDGPPGQFQNYDDNGYRVCRVLGSDTLTIIEGITIRAAAGTTGSYPQAGGGGLACVAGKLQLSHCTFALNNAGWGGGAFLQGSDSDVQFCQFLQNRVRGPMNFGGGLYGGRVFDSDFIGNKAIIAAGGAGASGGYFERCVFDNNSANGHGGAINGGGQIIACTFVGNHAAEDGGAIWGYPTVISCSFDQNSADSGGAIRGIVTAINSRFTGNWTSGFAGSAIRGGGTIINCEFIANRSLNTSGGGAISACLTTGGPLICAPIHAINCIFEGNASLAPGGGAWVEPNQTAIFTNCIWTGNTSSDPGGAVSTISKPNVPTGFASVRNSIAWNNSPGEFTDPIDVQYSCVKNGWPGPGNISADPMFRNPLGPDGIAGTEDDDLRLARRSPCIDAGDNTALPQDDLDQDGDGDIIEPLPIDLDGALRRVNDPATPNTGYPLNAQVIVDMGAYEFADFPPLPGDANHDGVVNVNDLLMVIHSWGPCPASPASCPADLDRNGVVNHLDLLFVVQHWG